ncbi:MAG: bifunctional precorrin-2 dehydrogenase/sirohydrochlorin ferrochelatase [Methanomicrobiales archaeon]|jgi:precorrin-2 dehydrogenase/sirohydrochlorin ferrochelatase|nr:bifunctional precorrin-2 dehydrogenase/sirohydrochlorin ferrochelatase [Methanomicrobiales archaeon]
MLPLVIDCSRKKIVIIGGGKVAARKAAYFSDADVTMYSEAFQPDIPPYVTCVFCTLTHDRGIIQDIIEGAFLVIAATSDPDLNTLVIEAAHDAQILCNNANGKQGDVIFPAQVQRGDVVIAVSSGGVSPALAQFLRIHLEEMFPELEKMAIFLAALKDQLKDSIYEQKERSLILHKALRDPILLEKVYNTKNGENDTHLLAVQYIQDYMAGLT